MKREDDVEKARKEILRNLTKDLNDFEKNPKKYSKYLEDHEPKGLVKNLMKYGSMEKIRKILGDIAGPTEREYDRLFDDTENAKIRRKILVKMQETKKKN
jgi:hypothetical protein